MRRDESPCSNAASARIGSSLLSFEGFVRVKREKKKDAEISGADFVSIFGRYVVTLRRESDYFSNCFSGIVRVRKYGKLKRRIIYLIVVFIKLNLNNICVISKHYNEYAAIIRSLEI